MITVLKVFCVLTSANYHQLEMPSRIIGELGEDRLFVTPLIRKTSNTECMVSIRFSRIHHGRRVSSKTMKAGLTYGVPTIIVRELLSNDRSQVFLELAHNQTKAFLLDYDGKSIKVLYSNIYGRVDSLLSYDEAGNAVILEYWPYLSYKAEFEDDKSPYKSGGRSGTVRRTILVSTLVSSPVIDGKRTFTKAVHPGMGPR